MKRLFSLMTILLLMTGCQNTTVLLHARYLSEDTATQITERLEAAEFNVEVNDYAFPKGVRNSTIIGSPLLQDATKLDAVALVMDELHWPIYDIRSLTSQNHWFTKDTIGLYLVPAGIDPHEGANTADIANKYIASNCQKDLTLVLEPNNEYRLIAADVAKEDEQYLQGKWRIRGNQYIEMLYNYPSNEAWFMEISHEEVQDQISQITLIKLRPVQKFPIINQCGFEFGTRIN